MGDANANAESRIANSGTNLQPDILKVGHHGSATSSSSAFLSKVHPKTSIIEVGAGNSYGHPTSATLGRLAQVGPTVYRTGQVHQREVGVNVSLSVLHEYDQQRRTFREAVCEERARAAAGAGASRQARGVLHLNRATPEKQGW